MPTLLGLLVSRAGTPHGEALSYSCTTPVQGGRLLVTFSTDPVFAMPEHWDAATDAGPTANAVLRRQLQRLKDLVAEPMSKQRVTPLVIELNEQWIRCNIERRLFSPMSDAEVQEFRRQVV
jgi:hypothetical protein